MSTPIKVFRIRDKKTGLYSPGGRYYSHFTSPGEFFIGKKGLIDFLSAVSNDVLSIQREINDCEVEEYTLTPSQTTPLKGWKQAAKERKARLDKLEQEAADREWKQSAFGKKGR